MISYDAGLGNAIDLHEMTWHEALPEFIAFYNEALQRAAGSPAGSLNVIHGYGSTGAGGVLRKRLRLFLKEHESQGRLEFTPGEYVDANLGHTLVQPIQPLPVAHEMLADEILAYCANPRTLSKICGKFRRHSEPAVKAAVESLIRSRRLQAVGKGSRKMYKPV